KLRQSRGSTVRALEFAILTAARAGETVGATWDEIDLGERVWTIPAARMKSGREHRVPLSDAAVAILEKMAAIRHSDYVFPGQRGKLNKSALSTGLKPFGVKATAHGFRSTFAQWAAERTAHPSEVREMALAHTVGS